MSVGGERERESEIPGADERGGGAGGAEIEGLVEGVVGATATAERVDDVGYGHLVDGDVDSEVSSDEETQEEGENQNGAPNRVSSIFVLMILAPFRGLLFFPYLVAVLWHSLMVRIIDPFADGAELRPADWLGGGIVAVVALGTALSALAWEPLSEGFMRYQGFLALLPLLLTKVASLVYALHRPELRTVRRWQRGPHVIGLSCGARAPDAKPASPIAAQALPIGASSPRDLATVPEPPAQTAHGAEKGVTRHTGRAAGSGSFGAGLGPLDSGEAPTHDGHVEMCRLPPHLTLPSHHTAMGGRVMGSGSSAPRTDRSRPDTDEEQGGKDAGEEESDDEVEPVPVGEGGEVIPRGLEVEAPTVLTSGETECSTGTGYKMDEAWTTDGLASMLVSGGSRQLVSPARSPARVSSKASRAKVSPSAHSGGSLEFAHPFRARPVLMSPAAARAASVALARKDTFRESASGSPTAQLPGVHARRHPMCTSPVDVTVLENVILLLVILVEVVQWVTVSGTISGPVLDSWRGMFGPLMYDTLLVARDTVVTLGIPAELSTSTTPLLLAAASAFTVIYGTLCGLLLGGGAAVGRWTWVQPIVSIAATAMYVPVTTSLVYVLFRSPEAWQVVVALLCLQFYSASAVFLSTYQFHGGRPSRVITVMPVYVGLERVVKSLLAIAFAIFPGRPLLEAISLGLVALLFLGSTAAIRPMSVPVLNDIRLLGTLSAIWGCSVAILASIVSDTLFMTQWAAVLLLAGWAAIAGLGILLLFVAPSLFARNPRRCWELRSRWWCVTCRAVRDGSSQPILHGDMTPHCFLCASCLLPSGTIDDSEVHSFRRQHTHSISAQPQSTRHPVLP